MIRLPAVYTRRAWWHTASLGILCLLLAGVLAACGPGSPGGAGTFPKDKLSLLGVPASYALPGQIARGPDGNLWFPAIAYLNFATKQPSGAIGRLTAAGQFHLFPLPNLNSYPTAITFGSDGSIWFVVFQGNGQLAPIGDTAPRFTGGFNEIGHMTPDGQFQFFPLPSAAISLTSIAAGADGNLWFTENVDNGQTTSQQIGRMTPAGVFSAFVVTAPFNYGYLRQIIAGADGNLWFSLEGSDANNNALGALGKITPQGAISLVQLGKFATALDMTMGPDQNLWFTTYAEVGRVTPDGQVQMFAPDPTASQNNHVILGGIASGPDGALWFATENVAVGRITTTGAVKFYMFPANTDFDNGSSSLTLGQLKGIVTGADGALWLTDGGQVGHFV